jgi:hypothetical protein
MLKYFLKFGGLICIRGAGELSSESVGGVTDIRGREEWFDRVLIIYDCIILTDQASYFDN